MAPSPFVRNLSSPRRIAALLAVGALGLTACAAPQEAGGGGGEAISVGVITSTSGMLSSYGQQFTEGFNAGLDYATDGTGEVDGQAIDVTFLDDATDPATATQHFTTLVGEGTTIITGPVSSGVAMQLVPLAEQNQTLYISGAAAVDQITGANDYTFRSGRQTYQDVVTAGEVVGEVEGTRVTVFAQDYDFGQANVTAVQSVLGDEGGAEVTPVLAPVDANEFTPFARQVADSDPELTFVAWAGESTNAMWQTLSQQGIFDQAPVVTGLADRASFPSFGPAATEIDFLSHYFAEASDNEANQALIDYLSNEGVEADIFHNDGFVAAQMVVQAVTEGDAQDVDSMITALEGHQFEGPKGEQEIRAEDHAMLQPMFTAHLEDQDGTLTPVLDSTLPAADTAPPVASAN